MWPPLAVALSLLHTFALLAYSFDSDHFLLHSLEPIMAAGTVTNRTIDDNYGDSVTGVKPTYSDSWNYGPDCTVCLVQPVVSETFDKSWHDVTASPDDTAARNVTLTFTGTAVWVYGIVPNYVEAATTFINISFVLDGKTAGLYTHVPSLTEDYEYNVTFFSNTALENVQHTLVITPQRETNASYMAFDWAQYTVEDLTTTSSSSSTSAQITSTGTMSTSTGALLPSASVHTTSERSSNHKPVAAIAGGVVGGVVLIILLVVAALMYHRRRHGGVDKIVNARRGAQRSATHVNPFVDPSIGQPSVYAGMSRMSSIMLNPARMPHATNAPDDDPSVPFPAMRPVTALYKNGASLTNLWVLPANTPGASQDALLSPSPPSTPIPPALPPSTIYPSSAAHAKRPSHMPQPRTMKAFMRREELSRQMRDIENAVADLRRRQSSRSAQTALSPASPFPSSQPVVEDSDAVLRQQIEALQLEVERLRVEQDLLLRAPPPAYQQGEEEVGH